MRLRDAGEDAAIEAISRFLGNTRLGSLSHPDDARDAIPLGPRLVFNVDGYSIRSLALPWRSLADIGWSAVVGALSDHYAKGSVPAYAMVALGLDPGWEIGQLEELARGLWEAARAHGVEIVGGDTNSAGDPWIAVAVIGFSSARRLPGRRGMGPGDRIVVTGTYGAMGFVSLRGIEEAGRRGWVVELTRRPRPDPRVAFAVQAAHELLRASMDVSDGLGYTLLHLSRLNGVGIVLEDLPPHPSELEEECGGDRECLWRYVLSGGEEYGCVFAVGEDGKRFLEELDGMGVEYKVVGRAVEGPPGVFVKGVGEARFLAWDQFAGFSARG
ncbi:MAG: thiamine-phosphate kinase [Desulfurococcaceae archaeon]